MAQWRRAIPERIQAVDSLLAEFKDPLPSANALTFRGLVAAGTAPTKNEIVSGALDKTRDQVARLLLDLNKIEQWIALSVPTIEDGGNFGVAIQEETRKAIKAERLVLKAAMEKARRKEEGYAASCTLVTLRLPPLPRAVLV